jgi:Fic family protein
MEYISISSILKKAPAKYARAYLYTETDDNDTTYFVDYNLVVVLRAIARLREYLIKKASEIQRVEASLGNTLFARQLNYRQLSMISHVLRNPRETYTIESHRNSHNISYPTARSDLLKLAELDLLVQKKLGKTFVFVPVEDMESKIEALKS